MRPVEYGPRDELLRAGGIELNLAQPMVHVDGRFLRLTRTEYFLLAALMRRMSRVVSREELYLEVWRAPMRRGDRSVDVYVRKLRAKLADAQPEWAYIHTHFQFGYRFSAERLQDLHTHVTAS